MKPNIELESVLVDLRMIEQVNCEFCDSNQFFVGIDYDIFCYKCSNCGAYETIKRGQ